jgi:hypothetical protein
MEDINFRPTGAFFAETSYSQPDLLTPLLSKTDIERNLRELGGLFAGIKYLDSIEPVEPDTTLDINYDADLWNTPAEQGHDSTFYWPDPESHTIEPLYASTHTLRTEGQRQSRDLFTYSEGIDARTFSKSVTAKVSELISRNPFTSHDRLEVEAISSAFLDYLTTIKISRDGIRCGCPFGSQYGFSSAPGTLRLGLHDEANMIEALEHFFLCHGRSYLGGLRGSRVLIHVPEIRRRFQHLKLRQYMLQTINTLQNEEKSTRDRLFTLQSYVHLQQNAHTANEIRMRLLDDIRYHLQSLEKKLCHEPSNTLPDTIYNEIQRVVDLLDKYLTYPEATDLANLKDERKKLRTLLEQIPHAERPRSQGSHEKQWANLRSLRAASFTFHSRIRSTINKAGRKKFKFKQNIPIGKLWQQIKSASDFLITGILTFRKVLQCSAPSSLKEVLAFVSLSHVMADELWLKGVLDHPFNLTDGYRCWKQAIRGQTEQEAFQELAQCLWPDSRDAFSTEPMQVSAVQLETTTPPQASFDSTLISECKHSSRALGSNDSNIFSPANSQSSAPLPQDAEDQIYDPRSINDAGGTGTQLDAMQKVSHSLLSSTHESEQHHFADFLTLESWDDIMVQSCSTVPPVITPEENCPYNMAPNYDFLVFDSLQPKLSAEIPNGTPNFETPILESTSSSENHSEQSQHQNTLAILLQTSVFRIALAYLSCRSYNLSNAAHY